MKIRRSNERGHAVHGWLNARHTFSFASYFDPNFISHGPLRVMNEDRIKPERGFGMHPHNDMEILTYVLSGSLEHKDDMGNGSIIQAGDFQRMSAGTGIVHSEFNPSKTEETHLYQIWIEPSEHGLSTGYEQRSSQEFKRDKGVALIASQSGSQDSMKIQQASEIYLVDLNGEDSVNLNLNRPNGWLQVVSGSLLLNDVKFSEGDGVAFEGRQKITMSGNGISQVLVFDLPN